MCSKVSRITFAGYFFVFSEHYSPIEPVFTPNCIVNVLVPSPREHFLSISMPGPTSVQNHDFYLGLGALFLNVFVLT